MAIPKRPSVKRFDQAPQSNIPRSVFDLSHAYKTTFDSGWLIPFLCQEVVPADSFTVRSAGFIRLATPLHPTLDNLHAETFYFFCPNRLVWDNFQRFMGEQKNPGDSTDFLIPSRAYDLSQASGTIYDYFGLPLTQNVDVSVLPFRAYTRTWDDWFRDENLQNSASVTPGDTTGADVYALLRRGKRKDYISSCLPFPQKGPGVDLPLGDVAPVRGLGVPEAYSTVSGSVPIVETGGNIANYDREIRIWGASDMRAESLFDSVGGNWAPNIYADLSEATASTINELRQAFQIQKLQERDARGGTRYTEIIRSHFLTVSPDQRLQRVEYLGGGYATIQMNTVPQTSGTPNQTGGYTPTPQGNLTAYGVGSFAGHGFTKSFVEHGYILGLIAVRADLNYQQRLDRHWSRRTKYDFYWPALQAIGEQPVYNKEVWHDGTAADSEVWGYQERWSEMRQQLGVITGLFRSQASESLDPWHYALDFEARPALNSTFIQDQPPIDRTVAVPSEPEFIMDVWHQIKAARPMPVYSVPGYIDHF